MSNPWAAVKPTGAWASQVDEEEAAQGGALGAPEEAFPDLSMAATKKESKRDKKKKQTVSLAEFQTGKKAYQAPKRAPAKEEIVLPSGPRAREDDDDGNSRGGLGGAFAGGRDYKDRVGGFRDRDDDDDDRGGRQDDGPSRADAADSWGGEKKFQPSSAGGGFGRDRDRGSFDDADGDRPPREELGPSKADTSSSWGADRRPREPSPDRPARGGGFGDSYTERDRKQTGGFADRYGEDRTSFADRGPSKADEEDRWSRKPVEPSSDRPSRGVDRNSSFGAPRSDSGDRWGARRSASPTDAAPAAGASERRRLNLSARTAPPKELPPIVAPTPKPASDEPESAIPKEQPDAPALPPKPKSNPFGTARPREEVLKEQGRDWKREERALEHSRVKRDPSEEEMQLGDKIAGLQQRVEQGEADQPASESKPAAAKENADPAETPEVAPRNSDDDTTAAPVRAPVSYAAAAKPVGGEEEEDEPQTTVQQALDDLEAQLAKLTAELDDKVRFSKGTGADPTCLLGM
ncbi:hypothetical protein WJX82_009505 [Trebouxia sp. C0006]